MTQTYRYPEGDVYEGDWSKEGKKHGIGRISFTDESMYEGRFMNGFFSGYGTLRLADGTVYAGIYALLKHNLSFFRVASPGTPFKTLHA